MTKFTLMTKLVDLQAAYPQGEQGTGPEAPPTFRGPGRISRKARGGIVSHPATAAAGPPIQEL